MIVTTESDKSLMCSVANLAVDGDMWKIFMTALGVDSFTSRVVALSCRDRRRLGVGISLRMTETTFTMEYSVDISDDDDAMEFASHVVSPSSAAKFASEAATVLGVEVSASCLSPARSGHTAQAVSACHGVSVAAAVAPLLSTVL